MSFKHVACKDILYETQCYDIFKHLDGNREIEECNVKRIRRSLKKFGYIGAPVIINEKNEVIDGQNRIAACREENVPVQYKICPGYGIEECIALNQNQKNWNNRDFIESYSAQGYDTYTWLLELQESYSLLSLDDMSALAYNRGKNMTNSSKIRDVIRSGQLVLNEDEKKEVEDTLVWLYDFAPFVKKIGGRNYILYNTIIFMYTRPNVDGDKLLDKVFKKNWTNIERKHTPLEYIIQLEDFYNYKVTKEKKIFLESEFKQMKTLTS